MFQQGEKQIFRPSEGQESLLQLIRLCEDPNVVGLKLLEKINTLPLRDLNSSMENLTAMTEHNKDSFSIIDVAFFVYVSTE